MSRDSQLHFCRQNVNAFADDSAAFGGWIANAILTDRLAIVFESKSTLERNERVWIYHYPRSNLLYFDL